MEENIILNPKIKDELFNLTKKSNFEEAIKDLIKRELIRRKHQNLLAVSNFEKKYSLSFMDFEKLIKKSKMNNEQEKDYFDWDMATTVLEDIDEELKGL